jgi:tricorn protease
MAQERECTSGYLRQPTVHAGTVIFACEDDLWVTPADGGRAWRLTAGVAEASHPRLSPDGSQLAFVGSEEGPPEVYVMPASGGVARRLTYQAAAGCTVVGWDPAGAVLYSSPAELPNNRSWLYRISPDGGLPERVELGPVRSASYAPSSSSGAGAGAGMVIGRRVSREPAWWKRYRGGTSGDLWIDPTGSGEFSQLLDLAGNLANPCWVGDRIYFLSDHEGIGNVYSCTPDGTDLRRHTDHEDYYARNLSSDAASLVYHSGGELYLLTPEAAAPRRIDIRLDSSRTQRNRRFVSAEQYLDSATLNNDGSGLAITTRGKAFAFANWEGPVQQLGEPDGERYRLLHWLADRRRLLAVVSDDSGGERLVLLTADGSVAPRRLADLDVGRVVSLELSPAADLVALTTHRHELLLVDLTGPEPVSRLVDRSRHHEITDLAWSADGRWLAYGFAETAQTRPIKLCRVETGETWPVTEPVLADSDPAFDPEGRYLYFIGRRDFDPVYDRLQFDLSFPKGERPYAIALRADVPSPFVPQPRPLESEDAAHARKGKEDTTDRVPPVEIDLDGITRRLVAFPVPEGRYGRVAGVKGKVLFSQYPVEGSRRRDWPRPTSAGSGTLECYDLDTQQQEHLAEEISDFWLGPDAKTLLYQSGSRLRVLRAGEKPAEDGSEPGRATGWIDLDRVKVSVRPAAEWRQMFQEAWRLQRENFWAEDMSGVDWDEVYQRYLPLVDRVSTRAEFSDLLWEVQGELGTSHAYEMGGEYRLSPHYEQGFLGVDWAYDAETGSYRIGRIIAGDPWDLQATSPLNRPGTGVEVGDEVLAINGQPVGGQRSNGAAPGPTPGERLVNLADEEVQLTVRRGTGEPRTVSVRAVSDEQPGRYRDWVTANRQRVRERTGGRVGYVHVPDMGPDGYAEFHRGYLAEYDHDALIIDVRYNRGGHVSGLLMQKLARRRFGYDFSRWGQPDPYPAESPRGPLVALTNEWAGSDGDIFSHTFKLLKLGPLIGKRTWGGVVGVNPRYALADGTITTQPEYSFAFDDVDWRVENYGTDPDIEVDITPQDYARGLDPQLDKAIEVALQRIAEQPPHAANPPPRPRLTPPKLPPRQPAAEPRV